mmetsp:Transcript_13263/g.25179  ORF Transcript_13263/g.25179 Transcript_13263/m.25179 type:complete len:194 (-) Transcript_13263:249-830(-)
MADSGDLKVKIAVLGSGGVGKSCLTLRLTTGNFEDEYDPTIADLYETNLKVDGKACALDITDTAGQIEYMSVVDEWIQKGEGFLLVCSVDSEESVERLHEVKDKICLLKGDIKTPMVIAANKCDLEKRVVSKESIKELAEEWGIHAFETSAKAEINVTEAFHQLVREVRKYKGARMKNSEKKETKKKGFCTLL